jgi:hypothetical protein
MSRIALTLLVVQFLAGCAALRTVPSHAEAPIPALSYASVLDGGKVTPIQTPVMVRYAPYPPASFERLTLYKASGIGEPIRFSQRLSGTTSATAAGDLIAITFNIQGRVVSGNVERRAEDRVSLKGTSLTLLVPPYGPIKEVKFVPPTLSGDQTAAEAVEHDLRDEFTSEATLPKGGFKQSDAVRLSQSVTPSPGRAGGSFEGDARVQGIGTYRDRPVIVFDLSGVVHIDGRPFGLHSYMFLDIATGIWSHMEMLVAGSLASDKGTELLTLRAIDDVRF